MSPLPLSNIFTQTPQVIYHRKRKNQGGLPTCKRSAVKRNTSTRRQAATSSVFICSADYAVTSKWSVSETSSQATKGSDFTSKASLEFGEDVKKRLRLLSEVVLRTVKRRLPSSPYGLRRDKCVFVSPFFCKKKWRERRDSNPQHPP